MAIFAIADLHLSHGTDKPMDIFGTNWERHEERLKEAWLHCVTEEDTVLIPGDISWGMTLDEALPDLVFLDQLPGRKILSKGNHDYWWGTSGKLETFQREHGLTTLSFLKNNAFLADGRAICGSRGWLLPQDPEFKPADQVILERELSRLERSILSAKDLLVERPGSLIALLHFPPLMRSQKESDFTRLLEKHGIGTCIYGHLHGRGHQKAFEGNRNGVEYLLASGDYISFKPLRL